MKMGSLNGPLILVSVVVLFLLSLSLSLSLSPPFYLLPPLGSPPSTMATVQHVPKQSSDQLLSKFAQLDSHSPKFKRRPRTISHSRSHAPSTALVERRSLLSPSYATPPPTFLPQLRIPRTHLPPTHFSNKSLFRALHKTWRSTIRGTSRVFMEKHYHRHKRLINDVV